MIDDNLKRYYKDIKKQKKNDLVTKNLDLVIKIAKKYKNYGVPLNDLINDGNIGLIKASQKYNESFNIKFTSYAYFWIKESIISSINNNSRTLRIPIGEYNKQKRSENKTKIYSLNNFIDDENNEYCDIIENCVMDNDELSLHDGWDCELIKNNIDKLLEGLTPKEKFIIEHYYGLNDVEKQMKYVEIGKLLGLSSERVRKIKQQALRKLKNNIIYIKNEL